ncbi:unnamed protein product [Hymenolepis diminuta]|uniref:Dynein light chain n=1 Tax=Hymenolepis diminuta TaxID=6216 RepID=A0A0R3SA95_HYMDI|nr:unnamed protein product [Hymenolepis diminuta]VUZ51497.1 unnamed protein product [Hymenolepis diminuta]
MSSKYVISNIDSDMVERRREDTKEIITQILNNEPDCRTWPQCLCRRIKERCEDEFTGTWNCHVGPSFGSSFPYEANSYFYGEWDDLSILLYKYK